jgi:hypothetical protein
MSDAGVLFAERKVVWNPALQDVGMLQHLMWHLFFPVCSDM